MKLIFLLPAIFVSTFVFSQKDEIKVLETWENDTSYTSNITEIAINGNQSSFSPNWKAGGVNSFSIGSIINQKNAIIKNKNSFESLLNLQYGSLKAKNQSIRKTTDVLLVDLKLARRISQHWSVYLGPNLITQLSVGYKYSEDTVGNEIKTPISNFFSPAYVTIPLGFQYKADKYFYARFGVFSLRRTYVTDTTLYKNVPENFGVEIGKTYRDQIGMQVVSGYKREFNNITLDAYYIGFVDYGDLNLSRWVHRLNIVATAKVTKYLTTSLSILSLYDYFQDKDVQISQSINLGFLYTIQKPAPAK